MNIDATGPVKFKSFAVAASGDNACVPAVLGKKIRILSLVGTAGAAVAVKLRSATTDISGAQSLAANTPMILPHNPFGWCETAVGEALQINLGAAQPFNGMLTYQEVA